MSQYIITIVPVVDEQFTGSTAHTVVRVETDGGQATVKELTIRAPDDAGLVGGEIPEIDYELLLRALTPRHARPTAVPPRPAAGATATVPPRAARPPAPQARRVGDAATPGGRSIGSKQAAKLGHLKAGRAYRRAPDNAALEDAYLQTGSIAGVAEHFGVPVHTAQGWISRMRQRNVEHSSD